MDIREAFAASAGIYDRSRRQLVPCFDDLYRVAVGQAPFPADAPLRILDLGAGTGLMSASFADAFPAASFTLVDVADEMLDHARARFAGAPERFAYLVADYAAAPLPGPVDLVVSGLSIHHVDDAAKRALFAHIHAALVPGGAFVNADVILGTTPAVEARNQAAWLAEARRRGAAEADIGAARARMAYDRAATVEDQLRWLRDAGFRDVDCAYRWFGFAVFGGIK